MPAVPSDPNTTTSVDTKTPQSPSDNSSQAKLPHERDQSINMTGATPSPAMQQAQRDINNGLVDTDARGADGQPLGDDVPAG